MGRKGKAQKHTAKEINGKHKAAREAAGAAGGGGSGAAARKNAGAAVSVVCDVCKVAQPNLKSMTLHFENKHAKLCFDVAKWEAAFNAKRAGATGSGKQVKHGATAKKPEKNAKEDKGAFNFLDMAAAVPKKGGKKKA